MFEQPAGNVEKDRSRMIMALSAGAVILVIGLILLVRVLRTGDPQAIEIARPGTPMFNSYIENVSLTVIDKWTGERLDHKYARIRCSVKNNGDRVITALELRGALIGFSDEVLKEKLVDQVPRQEDTLKPGEVIEMDIYIEPSPDLPEIREMIVEIVGLSVR